MAFVIGNRMVWRVAKALTRGRPLLAILVSDCQFGLALGPPPSTKKTVWREISTTARFRPNFWDHLWARSLVQLVSSASLLLGSPLCGRCCDDLFLGRSCYEVGKGNMSRKCGAVLGKSWISCLSGLGGAGVVESTAFSRLLKWPTSDYTLSKARGLRVMSRKFEGSTSITKFVWPFLDLWYGMHIIPAAPFKRRKYRLAT